MTSQIVKKKHVHPNTFAKNQGRATALPCPTGSFAPGWEADVCALGKEELPVFIAALEVARENVGRRIDRMRSQSEASTSSRDHKKK
jgi:hypothetical protein